MSSRSISRVFAVLAAGAALAAATALPATAATAPHSPVTFGAIQYDSPGKDDGSQRSLNAEWVTVTNTGRSSVNLKGWTLSDRSHHVYTFGGVHPGRPQLGARPHRDRPQHPQRRVPGPSRVRVEQHGDTATLRDNHSHVIATKTWGRR